MPLPVLVWAALVGLGVAPAQPPASEREREQNRAVSDLAVHTAFSAGCAHQLRLESAGQKCWVWAFALEGGVAFDRQDPSRGEAFAQSLLLGWQPLTFGSWYFKDQHRFTDFEVGFVEPFLLLRGGLLHQPTPQGEEVRRFFGFIAGSRAWVGWTFLRAGVELSYELGPPELARGLTFAGFLSVAFHYAPLRGERRRLFRPGLPSENR